MSQSSFFSVNDMRLHFGLGEAKSVDLAIHWPSGLEEKFTNVAVDQIIRIEEGKGIGTRKGALELNVLKSFVVT